MIGRAALLVGLGLLFSGSAAMAQQGPPPPPTDFQALMDAWDSPEEDAQIAAQAADAVLAAEARFAELARTIGQWRAFHATAHVDARMFVPQEVHAVSWLTDRPDPPVAVSWQPQAVYTSCNGRAAVTTGGWHHPADGVGYFTTVWQQSHSDGWRWVVDHGDRLQTARPTPAEVTRRAASCANFLARSTAARHLYSSMTRRTWFSDDSSLVVEWQVGAMGERELWVRMWNGTDYVEVIHDVVGASDR